MTQLTEWAQADSVQQPNDYFEVVRRPLDMPFGNYLYNWTVHPSNPFLRFISQLVPDAAHWHLVSPSNENVGHASGGLFSEKGKRYERVPEYMGLKIPGYKVRSAVNRSNAGWEQATDYFATHPEIDLDGFDPSHEPYNLFIYNCKDFIKSIEPLPSSDRLPSLLEMFAMSDGEGGNRAQ